MDDTAHAHHPPRHFVYRPRPHAPAYVPVDERDTARLQDMRRLYRAAAQLVARTNEERFLSEEGFADRLIATGIIVHLARVAKSLSTSFTDSHPEVDWNDLINLRDRVANLADDYGIVWRALTRDFPADSRALI